jgi:eukaryotic-like serine/threonine-protein kinase
MKWLSDRVVDRLQTNLRLPDLSGTRYRALRYLAGGGMGTVWLAEDTVLDRRVALKILDAANDSSELASRLLREARVLARLEHPGIVPVHDAGTLGDGRAFYCMKYVDGQTLDQYVRSSSSLPERLNLVQRIAEPLAFAHSKGVLHRDLKPENVMIGAFGEVLVMDWGVAKVKEGVHFEAGTEAQSESGEDSTASAGSLPETWATDGEMPALQGGLPETAHGRILGTPGYMSPEQAQGEIDSIDERTDIFSLGAILAFMLAGGGQQALDRSRPSQPVPRPLKAICAKAMAPDPARRYRSVQELSSDLANYLEGLPVAAYREGILERSGRVFARHRVAIVLVAAYLLMRLLFILFSRP